MNILNKTILIIVAHPDDEIIFGWPILQDVSFNKNIKILCCSSDLNNPERKWCKHRKEIFLSICSLLGIEKVKCLDYNSEFYRMETRQESLSRMMSDVLNHITSMKPFDYIYTHNFWGEYGHLDHILINNICTFSGNKLILSDMFCPSNWIPYKEKTSLFREIYDDKFIKESVLNIDWYEKYKAIYNKNQVWTWNQPPITKCQLGLFG